MPEIQPIDDSYIDGVIKAADAYNPNLSKTQGVRLRELIKLMRDRFEQRLATVPSGSASAESVQSYAAMLANGVPDSMTTYEVATDEKRNITNSIYQWWPDGKLFFIDTVLGSENIPTQTLPASTRALPFTCDPTTIESFTTSSDVVFSLDETNAVDGASVFLAILQNDPVDFPSNFIELAGSKQPVLGKMNYYIVTRLNGIYQFLRYQNITDSADSEDSVIGNTLLTVGTVDSTSVTLSWTTAQNATNYILKRYLTSDYTDSPAIVYSGSALLVADTGLAAGTHYYYKINPVTTSGTGRAAYADASTVNNSYVTIYEKIFDSTNDTGQGIGAEGNYLVVQDEGVNKLKLTGVNGKQQIAWYLGGNYSANDRLRITITGVKVTNGTGFSIYLSGTGGIDFSASGINNEVIAKEFTPLSNNGFCYLGIANGDNTEVLIRSIKIEKIGSNSNTNSKLTGAVFSYNGVTYSPDYAAANAFDGLTDNNIASCFASIENPSEVYIGLDLGAAKTVKMVKLYPRDSENGNTLLTDRLLNTKIQGSNTSTDTGFVDLYTVTSVTQGQFNIYPLENNSTAYSYYRLYKNDGTNLDVAEIEFYTLSTNDITYNGLIKIDLIGWGHHSGLADWNDYTYGMSPQFLTDTVGTPTGIKFIVDSGPILEEHLGFDPAATDNFPGSVSSTLWYQEAGGLSTWHFTGLNNSKTYTIKTYSFDNSDDGETSINWGGITQNTLSFNNTTELTFSNIAPVSGEIAGSFGGSGAYTVINGIILAEDANDENL